MLNTLQNNNINDIFQLKRLESVNIKYLSRLERAIFTGDNRTVKSLVKEDVNKINSKYGFSPFHYAVELGAITIVRELCSTRKKMVDLELKDSKGRNALMIAVIYEYLDIIQFLLEECKVKTGFMDNNGHTALNFAVFTLNTTAVKILITAGENVDSVDKYGKYIIHYAIIYNCIPILKCLLENKVDVNVKDSEARTVLEYVKDSQEMYALITGVSEDDLSDIVSFDTQNRGAERDSDIANDLVERLGIPLDDLKENDTSDYTSSFVIEKTTSVLDVTMDASFLTADQLSTTSEYLLMDSPILRQNSQTQTNVTLEYLAKIEYLEEQVTQEQNIREDLIQEKNQLVKMVSEIQESLNTETKEVDFLSEETMSKNDALAVKMLEKEIKSLNEEIHRMSQLNNELELEIVTEKKANISELLIAQNSAKELETKLIPLQRLNLEIIEKVEQKEHEIQRLVSIHESRESNLKQEIKDSIQEKDNAVSEALKLKNMLNQLESEKEELQNVIAQLSTDFNNLKISQNQKEEIAAHAFSKAEEYQKELQKEIERLSISNENQVQEINQLRIEKRKVMEDSVSQAVTISSIGELEIRLSMSESQRNELQTKLTQMKEQLKASNDQLSDKSREYEARKESDKLQTERLRQSIDSYMHEIEQLKLERDNCLTEGEESKNKLIEMEIKLNESNLENCNLQKVIDQIKTEIMETTLSYQQLLEKITQEKVQIESHKKEIEQLKTSNESYIREIDFLRDKLKAQKPTETKKSPEYNPQNTTGQSISNDCGKSLVESLLANEFRQVKQIHTKQLEEIQRLRLDLLKSLKSMDLKLPALEIPQEETSRHGVYQQSTNVTFPFIKATETFDKINTNLLSSKVALIYERRKVE